jgi:Zn-dependent alcohol dehydrogenase
MKIPSAYLDKLRAPLKLGLLTLDKPLKSGQVLVQILATAICGSQIGEIDGIKGDDKHLPHCLGHEAIARVVDSHESSKAQDGEFVILHWMKGSGVDAPSGSYVDNGTRINAGKITTFMSHAIVSENRLTKIAEPPPERIPLYSTIGCAHLTAYGVLTNDLKSTVQRRVLLIGGGGVGQAMIPHLRFQQTNEIVVIDRNLQRQEQCRRLGANAVFSGIHAAFGERFDAVIDFSGDPKSIEHGYNLLNNTGTLCLVGVTPVGKKISIDPMPLHYGKQIVGSYGGSCNPDTDIKEVLARIETAPEFFSLQEFSIFPLERVNYALDQLRLGKVPGRAIISFIEKNTETNRGTNPSARVQQILQ